MANEFWMFAVNVACHWGSLLTSGVIAVAVMIVEHWINRNIAWRNFILIMGLGLFVSCFLAWHDEHSNSEVLKIEKSDLTSQRGILQAKLDAAQSQINQLLSQLSGRPPIITTTIPRSWSLSEQQQHEFRNQLEGTKAAFIVIANMGNEQSVR